MRCAGECAKYAVHLCVAGAFALGFLLARITPGELAQSVMFYSHILEISEGYWLAESIPANDASHGGQYAIRDKSDEPLSPEDIPAESMVMIELAVVPWKPIRHKFAMWFWRNG